jgi:hypothetical protein
MSTSRCLRLHQLFGSPGVCPVNGYNQPPTRYYNAEGVGVTASTSTVNIGTEPSPAPAHTGCSIANYNNNWDCNSALLEYLQLAATNTFINDPGVTTPNTNTIGRRRICACYRNDVDEKL